MSRNNDKEASLGSISTIINSIPLPDIGSGGGRTSKHSILLPPLSNCLVTQNFHVMSRESPYLNNNGNTLSTTTATTTSSSSSSTTTKTITTARNDNMDTSSTTNQDNNNTLGFVKFNVQPPPDGKQIKVRLGGSDDNDDNDDDEDDDKNNNTNNTKTTTRKQTKKRRKKR